ncbi:MAG: hypothetical protein J3K34DRAFT_456423 [Monoraphidium minutum]|nr:MAG: hypothetical protein J3K34DRAFT_456423 [Monoraphidium minutum]
MNLCSTAASARPRRAAPPLLLILWLAAPVADAWGDWTTRVNETYLERAATEAVPASWKLPQASPPRNITGLVCLNTQLFDWPPLGCPYVDAAMTETIDAAGSPRLRIQMRPLKGVNLAMIRWSVSPSYQAMTFDYGGKKYDWYQYQHSIDHVGARTEIRKAPCLLAPPHLFILYNQSFRAPRPPPGGPQLRFGFDPSFRLDGPVPILASALAGGRALSIDLVSPIFGGKLPGLVFTIDAEDSNEGAVFDLSFRVGAPAGGGGDASGCGKADGLFGSGAGSEAPRAGAGAAARAANEGPLRGLLYDYYEGAGGGPARAPAALRLLP